MDPPVSLRVCSFYYQQLESLHVCSFHIPHMDPPVSLKCVFSLETIDGSTSVIACVFFLLTTTAVISCVFFSHTTYGSTSFIEMCVLFRDHTWMRLCHCICFFLLTTTRVIACV